MSRIGERIPSDFIRPQQLEAIKEHVVLDDKLRPIQVYTAIYDAKDGDVCALTVYKYYGLTGIIIGRKEIEGVWSAEWDF